jgi:hypothetical protein
VAEPGESICRERRRQQSATASRARETGIADTRIPAQRTRHDRKIGEVSCRPGQLVYRKRIVQERKLEPKWLGPYQVVKRVSDLVYKIRVGPRDRNANIEKLKFCRATREKLLYQWREKRQQQRRERYSQLDYRSESCKRDSDRSSSGSAESAFWPRSGYSHQLPEAEYCDDVNRSALQSDAADNVTQLKTGEPDTEQQEPSRGSHRYYLRPRAEINYKGM